nr:MAG TPA: hypothetical protein [Caudoviricetes sp.]
MNSEEVNCERGGRRGTQGQRDSGRRFRGV